MTGSFSSEELQEIKQLISWDMAAEGRDITSLALFERGFKARGNVIAKSPGRVAGLPALSETCRHFHLDFRAEHPEGKDVVAGQPVARIQGDGLALLQAERFMLNVLSHLSGIATITQVYVKAFSPTRIFDTRKTTPGWRFLEKYAVRMGGGHNHRINLESQVLVKDNHLAMLAKAGRLPDMKSLMRRLRNTCPDVAVEIEVETETAFQNAVLAGADIVMLDNWEPPAVRRALSWLAGQSVSVETELSGGITLANADVYGQLGVDRISTGALTHSAPHVDFSLDIQGEFE